MSISPALYDFITGLETLLYEDPVIKIRANIDNNTFIGIFFND